MRRIAIVRDGVIMNIVQGDVAPDLCNGSSVDVTGMSVNVGDRYGGGTTFTPPPRPKVVTWQAFMNRLTSTEEIDIEVASADTPSGTSEERRKQAAIRMFFRRCQSGKVDLGRGAVRNLINALEADGVLSNGRAFEILNNPIGDHERP